MLVHPGMLLALVAAALADRHAGLQQRLGEPSTRVRVTSPKVAKRRI
jgi:hypothetical protein